MLSNWLIDTELLVAPEELSIFQKELPLEWIEQALELTNKASIRRRMINYGWHFLYSMGGIFCILPFNQ